MLTLVLGGTRSGKSEHAEQLARQSGDRVTYVATARSTPDDADLQARIDRHRARRPPEWHTVEATGDLAALVESIEGTVLVDSLGAWLGGQADFAVDGELLARTLTDRPGHTIVVSEEVGLSVHPLTAVGRAFGDALGVLNQQVAAVAESVLLVVAGRVLPLP